MIDCIGIGLLYREFERIDDLDFASVLCSEQSTKNYIQ